jgi:hypothetical protein
MGIQAMMRLVEDVLYCVDLYALVLNFGVIRGEREGMGSRARLARKSPRCIRWLSASDRYAVLEI